MSSGEPIEHRSQGTDDVWAVSADGETTAPPPPPAPDPGPPPPPRPLAKRGRGGPRFATPQDRALAAEWCLRQFTVGRKQADIAHELGVAQSTVSDLIAQALGERKGLAVDQLRQVRGDALGTVLQVLAPHLEMTLRDQYGLPLLDPDGLPMTRPDLDVIDRFMRATVELSKLEGSAAPARVQVSRSEVDDRLEELTRTLHERAKGAAVPVER